MSMASLEHVSQRPIALEESSLRLDLYEPAFPSTLPRERRFFVDGAQRRRFSFGQSLDAPPPFPPPSVGSVEECFPSTSRGLVLDTAVRRRHVTDIAPFNLWDEVGQRFLSLSPQQRQWIYDNIPECKGMREIHPFLVLRCPTPPKFNCYTIGGRPTLFRESFDSIDVLSKCAIGNRYVTVDIRQDLLRACAHPTEAQINLIMNVVDFRVSRLHFYSGSLIFEILDDSMVSSRLPAKIGGLPCFYVTASVGVFNKVERSASVIIPSTGTSDDSVYSPLRPGVRVTSGDGQKSTSLGVLLQNHAGDMFLTVANHGFDTSDIVCHPFFEKVGKIVDRFVDSDIALVKMEEQVEYHTNDYFSVLPPKRLIPSKELRNFDFVMCDGYSTGGRTFMIMGFTFEPHAGVSGENNSMDLYRETDSILFSMSIPGSDDVVGGMCGCPVVKEEDCSDPNFVAGMIGSFRFSDGHHCFVPTLSSAVERNFTVVC